MALRIGAVRFRGKCSRHPNYQPEDGEGAIKGGCRACAQLLDIYQAHLRYARLLRQFRGQPEDPPPRSDCRQLSLFE